MIGGTLRVKQCISRLCAKHITAKLFWQPQNTITGPSLARRRNVIEAAFRWCVDDGPTLNAGLGSFVIFRGSLLELLKTLFL